MQIPDYVKEIIDRISKYLDVKTQSFLAITPTKIEDGTKTYKITLPTKEEYDNFIYDCLAIAAKNNKILEVKQKDFTTLVIINKKYQTFIPTRKIVTSTSCEYGFCIDETYCFPIKNKD